MYEIYNLKSPFILYIQIQCVNILHRYLNPFHKVVINRGEHKKSALFFIFFYDQTLYKYFIDSWQRDFKGLIYIEKKYGKSVYECVLSIIKAKT